VHFAAARRDGATLPRRERFPSNGRAEVRLAALRVALKLMGDELARVPTPV
jgi:nicotinamide-nucleotide amidase